MEGEAIISSAPLPPPEVIRQTAEKILKGSDYHIEAVQYDLSLMERVLKFIGNLFRPLIKLFQGFFDVSPVLGWVVIVVLAFVLVALIVHIIYAFKTALQSRMKPSDLAMQEEGMVDKPALWEERADKAAAASDYISALRFLFRAGLLRLEEAYDRTFKRAATNREYLRRFKQTPAFEPLSLFVEVIDTKWYGGNVCMSDDYQKGKDAHSSIRRIAMELKNAQRT